MQYCRSKDQRHSVWVEMMRKQRTWVVVADGEHARILVPTEGGSGWVTERSLDSATAHRRTADLVSDAPGRAFERAGPARHAVEPRSDPHRLAEQRFADVAAEIIDEAAEAGAFDRLVLIAPGRTLAELREQISVAARERLIGCLAKDLVKLSDSEIAPHLTWDLLHGGAAPKR